NIGTAFTRYAGLSSQGFVLKGLFDVRPQVVGGAIEGIPVRHVADLEAFCRSEGVAIGIITVPSDAAQEVADALTRGGVRAILNVAPVTLNIPMGVSVRNVDITNELRLLSYMLLAGRSAEP
ncbi:MAG: redox-sensing transcriptional repressor Rex, partial [bacterium]